MVFARQAGSGAAGSSFQRRRHAPPGGGQGAETGGQRQVRTQGGAGRGQAAARVAHELVPADVEGAPPSLCALLGRQAQGRASAYRQRSGQPEARHAEDPRLEDLSLERPDRRNGDGHLFFSRSALH